ncbi:MAG: hypothetical protein LBH52_04220 [Puniceicoccales bacterium]|jgi:hypothetical protein|nr:hypothetical protein [Puniceicoccales bacterium]
MGQGSSTVDTSKSDSYWQSKDVNTYKAQFLSHIAKDLYTQLKRGDVGQLKDLVERIVIATETFIDREGVTLIPTSSIFQAVLRAFLEDLTLMAKLPTGNNVLAMLDELLKSQEFYLEVEFVLPQSTDSPSCGVVEINIVNAAGETSNANAMRVKLPTRHEDFYNLLFFNATNNQVEFVIEPSFLVLLHELIHGLQDISWLGQTHEKILEQLTKMYASLNVDLRDQWLAEFFSSTVYN